MSVFELLAIKGSSLVVPTRSMFILSTGKSGAANRSKFVAWLLTSSTSYVSTSIWAEGWLLGKSARIELSCVEAVETGVPGRAGSYRLKLPVVMLLSITLPSAGNAGKDDAKLVSGANDALLKAGAVEYG